MKVNALPSTHNIYSTIFMNALILLAAGASSRLGSPKQLLPFAGTTLLRHITQTALQVVPQTVVVLGAHAAAIQPSVADLPVHITVNEQWEQGMASSIRCGVSAVLQQWQPVDNVLILLCDQPFVTGTLLQQLIEAQQLADSMVVASAYNDTVGVPALFHKSVFPGLLSLSGQEGAKTILEQYRDNRAVVAFAAGATDIDTVEEYDLLLKTTKPAPF